MEISVEEIVKFQTVIPYAVKWHVSCEINHELSNMRCWSRMNIHVKRIIIGITLYIMVVLFLFANAIYS